MMVRAGILGTGWIAQEHAIALAAVPGAEVVGVSSRSKSRADAFVAKYQTGRAFTYDELLASPDIDVVHICTRNAQHHDQTLGALRHGKHVVAEKPLALSTTESESMLDAAKASRAVHACNYNYRAYPAVQEARRFIESGELGEIYMVRGEYLQDWLLLNTDYNWRLDTRLGGRFGAMADVGSHLLDLIEHVTGARIATMQANLRTTFPERFERTGHGPFKHAITNDDSATVNFKMDRGVLGSIVVSQVAAGHKNRLAFEINGARASVAWSQEDSDVVWIGRRGEVNSIRARDAAMAPDLVLPPGHSFGWRDALRRNLASVYAAISGERPSLQFATFEDGHRSLVLLEAAIKSSTTGSGVSAPATRHSMRGGTRER